MPKLMSATCMAGARATAAAVVAPMKPPSQSESGGRRIDTRKTECFCFLSEAVKVSERSGPVVLFSRFRPEYHEMC